MRILDRLVGWSYIRLFVIFVLGAPLLFTLGDAVENLDRYLDRGLPFGQVVLSYLYQFPQFMLWSFPIASLLAVVFTIHTMTTHREVMAAKAGGISFHRLIMPLIVLGFVLTGVGLGMAEVVPDLTRKAAELRDERSGGSSWRSNFVYITDDGHALSVRRLVVDSGEMQGVVLERPNRDGSAPYFHLIAERAEWNEGNGWTFRQGVYRVVDGDGRERAYSFDSYRSLLLREGPEELVEEPRHEDEMTYAELGHLADRIRRSGGDPDRVLVKREQKLAIPVATLIIILFGAPLATSSKRGGTAFGIGLSLGTTIFYMLIFRVAGAFGTSGALSPLVAAWLPNAVFLAAGIILLARVRT